VSSSEALGGQTEPWGSDRAERGKQQLHADPLAVFAAVGGRIPRPDRAPFVPRRPQSEQRILTARTADHSIVPVFEGEQEEGMRIMETDPDDILQDLWRINPGNLTFVERDGKLVKLGEGGCLALCPLTERPVVVQHLWHPAPSPSRREMLSQILHISPRKGGGLVSSLTGQKSLTTPVVVTDPPPLPHTHKDAWKLLMWTLESIWTPPIFPCPSAALPALT